LTDRILWHDLSAKVEIQKSGGSVQAASAAETLGVWRGKGSWVRDGAFSGVLSLPGANKKLHAFTLHGEKGSLSIDDETGVSR
jgi:hypothetical protein